MFDSAAAMALNSRIHLWLLPLAAFLALNLLGCGDDGSGGSTPEVGGETGGSGTTGTTGVSDTTGGSETTGGFLGPTSTTSTTTWTFILPERSQAMDAQFLIQATFGPTRASLAEIGGMDYDAWLEAQLSLAPTLLRSHYRTRANPQVSEDKPAGVPRTACEPGSRWMQVTFMSTDVGARVVANGAQIFVAGALRTSLDANYTKNVLPPPMNCSSIGRDWWQWHPHRTCANQIRAWTCNGAEDWTKDKTCQQECFDGGYRYGSDDCSPGWPNFNFAGYLCSVEPAVAVGSQIELSVDAACEDKIVMLNPGLYVPGLTDVEGGFQTVRPSVIVLQQPPSNCDLQEFIQVDGQTFQHEPRLKLLDVTTPAEVCVAVPKTPMNVEACEVQAGRVCDLARGTDSALILNSSTLQLISEHANRHVFTVSGLSTSLSPCGTLARWKLLDCSTESCAASSLQANDLSLLRTALSTQVGGLRDVYVNCASVSAGSVVEVGSDTFQHVHIHEGNVYDFTEWVSSHPGGSTAITKWSSSGYTLQYPGNHPLERFETQVNNNVLQYIGKTDSEVRYLDLPTSLKTDSLALALANSTSNSQTLSLACPSPGEVANDPQLGNNMPFYYRFIDFSDLRNDLDFDHPSEHKHSGRPRLPRISAWMNQVARAPDQLRQRMAWALSQILVVGLGGFTYSEQHEIWVNYYDVLVRNAFGNYLDLLREVTFNPLMGEYLSFLRNTAFDHDQNYPDENYAREVMQLFSIGTVELNQDGSWVLDAAGNPVPTYDNDDIMTFASVLTGFDRQEWRSNIEMVPSTSAGRNIIDPMRMVSRWHDAYPKMDLHGNYLGDGYPLCTDLRDDQFLRTGARYEFFTQDAPASVLELRPDSALYKALCSADGSSTCRFASTVVLGADLTCHQEECRTTHPRVIKVGEAFYEFVPPPCVHFFFFEGRIATGSASRRYWQSRMICTNPETFVAGAYCCDGCSNIPPPQWLEHGNCQNLSDGWFTTSGCNIQGPGSWWDRNRWCEQRCDQLGLGYAGNCTKEYEEAHVCGYHQEYMSYEAATRRCADVGLKICDRGTELTTCGLNEDDAQVWTQEACTTNVTVDEIGRVSSQRTDKMKMNKLRVRWTNGSPDVQNCPADCTTLESSCECPIRVETRAVFNRLPVASELSALSVGAFLPLQACSHCGDVKAYTVDGKFDEKTVFEYQGKYYRNLESLVYVAGKSFRNPPRFGLEEQVNERSARWEIESLLEHLVNHPNTPTFIGYRLIQRFVTSNPSPGYVFDVAEAFKTGAYQGHTFSGRRGDLAATIAAILLHPEALGVASRRGALREPLVKIVHFLRAMDFEDAAGREIMFEELQELIGQGPFGSPSVFNFYRADYQSNTMPADAVAPEAQIMDASNMVNFLNGMLSLIKNGGVTHCDGGFGLDTKSCDQKSFKHGLNITQTSATQVLDDLDLLLTGGRMTNATRDVARASLAGWDEEQKVKAAQEAVILAPEFHTLGSPMPEGPRTDQTESDAESAEPRSYKALINLYLNGGADTFNLLVPLDCKLHDEYMAVRGQAALLNSELLEIQTTGQACNKFGIHHKLPSIQQLYRDGQAAFVSNVGSLVEPLNRNEYDNGLKPVCAGLFSHSDQTEAAQTLKCQIRGSAPKGVGGRMADALSSGTQQFRTASYSLSGRQTWAQGVDINQISVARSGEVPTLQNYTGRRQLLEDLSHTAYGNVYCEEYAKNLGKWVDSNQLLSEQLQTANLSTTWPENVQDWNRRQTLLSFQTVAKLIASRQARKVERDFFYVELRGFDTHNDIREVMEQLFDNLNFALESFVAELKAQGVFDATTLVTSSDFGRTLTSNGKGTDHGWAGNYVVLGGAIKGGQVYNRFPSSLVEGNNQDAGRGRMIPEYPWENVLMPIAEWMGVEGAHQRDVFPNIQNFNASHILATNVLFSS